MIFILQRAVLFFLVLFAHFFYGQTKVAVIGGGMAGISAAYAISKFDSLATVIVFEKEVVLGGNAQTIDILNSKNQLTKVDAGPQYFAEGPWDDYIKFLHKTLGKNPYQYESMTGTLLIQNIGESKPHLVTPFEMNLRGERVNKLFKFKRFNTEAYKMYKNPEKWKDITIETWYKQLKFSTAFKETIIYPFLAASLGTSVADIKTTSAIDVVRLFAFRKPKPSNKFHIMTEGMGTLIKKIGYELEKNGVVIKTNSPIIEIKKSNNKWLLSYKNNNIEHTELVDFVVLTTHADQAAKILNNDTCFTELTKTLKLFKYFEAKIALHKDESYINLEKPAFLNISTNNKNELLSSTMNLGMISERLQGIYKSWLTQEDINKVQAKGKLLHVVSFYHPLITPDFITNLQVLHMQLKMMPTIYLAGGWSEGLETQNSAVISGNHALDKYKTYLQVIRK